MRTVVFRASSASGCSTLVDRGQPERSRCAQGFHKNTGITFVTDRRSEKIGQIQHSQAGEACWYFTKTRVQVTACASLSLGCQYADLHHVCVQYRIRGDITLVTPDTDSEPLQKASTGQAGMCTWLQLASQSRHLLHRRG